MSTDDKKPSIEQIKREAGEIVAQYATDHDMTVTSVIDFGDNGPIVESDVVDRLIAGSHTGPARVASKAYLNNYERTFGSAKKRDPKLN